MTPLKMAHIQFEGSCVLIQWRLALLLIRKHRYLPPTAKTREA